VAGAATVETLSHFNGQTEISLLGPLAGTHHDRINVATQATLDGNLALSTGAYLPAYLMPHEVLQTSGGAVFGTYESVSGMVLSPTKYLAVTYDVNSVFVTAAIPGDANLDGTVDIGDFATLAANFNLCGTWVDGSFNGDLAIDIGDFALLAGNFNLSVPADLPRGAAVPEPATCCFALLTTSLLAERRRRA
jgi:hypothetical protein